MSLSERVALLGSGVFARNDQRKLAYAQGRIRGACTGVASGAPDDTSDDASEAEPGGLIDLSLGSTDLQPPAVALDAMARALRQPLSAAYCLHGATRPFREAAAAWVRRRFDVRVDPDREVLLLIGSQEGTAHLPLAVLNPGDSALLLDPGYPSHLGGLQLASATPVRLTLEADRGWRPAFERLPASTWSSLKLMVLGFPHNPTATTGDQAWLDAAVARAIDHDVVLLHDNPYVDLALKGSAPALMRHSDWRRCGVELFSLSKSWCLGGYRLAFAVGAEPLISALRQLKGVVDFNQSLALQAGAIAALEQAPEWPARLREEYRERRDRMALALEAAGWAVPRPSMALYLWLPLPEAARERGLSSEALCADLLAATGVCLTPGVGFGPGGEGWLRLALVHPPATLEEAAARMGCWLAGL
ncbi:MAG: aminotransferase class I/II-fold pyridoxal phosphate-dependent enzyme [Cyanobacteriota bacterium]|nr:aminotransferase class I/II-fold pyridoxal phosphate-dependent enzyme [Cyanobacteriota bacterium]